MVIRKYNISPGKINIALGLTVSSKIEIFSCDIFLSYTSGINEIFSGDVFCHACRVILKSYLIIYFFILCFNHTHHSCSFPMV